MQFKSKCTQGPVDGYYKFEAVDNTVPSHCKVLWKLPSEIEGRISIGDVRLMVYEATKSTGRFYAREIKE